MAILPEFPEELQGPEFLFVDADLLIFFGHIFDPNADFCFERVTAIATYLRRKVYIAGNRQS